MSLSKIISLGSLCLETTSFRNTNANSLAILNSIYSIRIIYFISRSIITKIKLYLTPVIRSLDFSSLAIESQDTNSQGTYSIRVVPICL